MTDVAVTGRMSTGQALARGLVARGIRHVFGIPGVHTLELFREFPTELQLVVPRHEQGAGFMADGYARVSGAPGVCLLVTGPGVTNALTPIAQAYHDSVPLLVIASESEAADSAEHGRLHELPDQRALLAQVTGSSASVLHPGDLPATLKEAWTTLLAPRPRPAAVGVPIDVLGLPSAPATFEMSTPNLDGGEEAQLDSAAALLQRAERPVILLGGGAIDASSEAVALAEALDAPVVLTANGAGTVPASHPLSLGVTLPFTPVLALLQNADVVLVAGSELSPVDRIYSGRSLVFSGHVIRIDTDPNELHASTEPTIAIQASVRAAFAGLLTRIAPGHSVDEPRTLTSSTAASELVTRLRAQLDWTEQSRGHLPWITAVDRGLPTSDRIVALDSTQLAYTALHALPVQRPRSLLAPFGFGTLGPALPMAIGAAIARPQRHVAAIIGDGGLMFTVAELATAAQLGIPLALVVWNSGSYAEIDDSFARAHITPTGVDVELSSLSRMADGLGCATVLARTPDELEGALRASPTRDRPTVIEVPATSWAAR